VVISAELGGRDDLGHVEEAGWRRDCNLGPSSEMTQTEAAVFNDECGSGSKLRPGGECARDAVEQEPEEHDHVTLVREEGRRSLGPRRRASSPIFATVLMAESTPSFEIFLRSISPEAVGDGRAAPKVSGPTGSLRFLAIREGALLEREANR
jgi:hypothetical protein